MILSMFRESNVALKNVYQFKNLGTTLSVNVIPVQIFEGVGTNSIDVVLSIIPGLFKKAV